MERCIHDLLREQCDYCRDLYMPPRPGELQLFLYRPANRLSRGGHNEPIYGITLQKEFGSNRVRVFLGSKIDCHRMLDESEINTKAIERLPKYEQRKIRICLRKLAFKRGLLFVPDHRLTQR